MIWFDFFIFLWALLARINPFGMVQLIAEVDGELIDSLNEYFRLIIAIFLASKLCSFSLLFLLFLPLLLNGETTAKREGGREGGRERQTDTHTQTQKMLKILKRNRYDAQLDGNIARKQQEQVDPDENQSGIEDSKRHIPRKTSSAIRPIKSHKTKNERIQLKRNTNPLPRILEHVRDDDDGDIGIQSEWRIDGFHGRSCHWIDERESGPDAKQHLKLASNLRSGQVVPKCAAIGETLETFQQIRRSGWNTTQSFGLKLLPLLPSNFFFPLHPPYRLATIKLVHFHFSRFFFGGGGRGGIFLLPFYLSFFSHPLSSHQLKRQFQLCWELSTSQKCVISSYCSFISFDSLSLSPPPPLTFSTKIGKKNNTFSAFPLLTGTLLADNESHPLNPSLP